jgi:hypothetical protein
MWLSLFRFRAARASTRHASGLYGVAFVDYGEEGVLTYQELAVARLVRLGAVPRVNITDIWVNSVRSRDGGRSLWSIPKDLADLHVTNKGVGPATRTSWSAGISGSAIAAANFTGVRAPSPRTPFALTIEQQRERGDRIVTKASGSAKTLPCLGTWDFGDDGPLAWLHGRQPFVSFRLSGMRLTVGA